MPQSYYSFWLVPQSPDLEDFQGIINTLSRRFDTVPFCPHVTLYSGLVPSTLDLQAALADLAPTSELELEILGVDHGSRFAKTLYIQLRPSPVLSQLAQRLVDAIPEAQLPTLAPHLSLLYHHLDDATKQDLSQAISLSRSHIRFNQVQVMASTPTFDTQAHVSSLRCVHSQLLSQ